MNADEEDQGSSFWHRSGGERYLEGSDRGRDGIIDSINGHEFEQTPGDGEGEGNLACYSPWGHKESDTT